MERFSKPYKDLLNEFLVLSDEGFDFLEIHFEENKESTIFLVESFQPPIGGSVQTAPYLKFKGAIVDDFFRNSIYNMNNKQNYISGFTQKNYEKEMINIEVSDNHKWRYYTK